ncbi:uncharacterized protein IL334_006076 [Kwoniella shivajii]|uniref:Uncharacterized protein n=1 Tax=Kwoniella shivajii TaxID=564305 RepID=A0ABZ1D588_9TREE|nr:hypothetical protein IL334_006076 [Kwoniella shivajii]
MKTLSHQSLSSDLNHILSLPPSTLSSLLDPSKITPTQTSQKPIEVLKSFSSQGTHEDSQTLSKAYIAEMGSVKSLGKSGEIENTGERIDGLRERGQGLVDTLSKVKV